MRLLSKLPGLRRARPEPEPRVGLAISGGGARADFQLGALRYLYDRVGIAPTTIVGTSAGSLLGAVLAQSADPAEQRRLLAQLEQIWRDMQTSDEIFSTREWFAILRRRALDWIAAQQKRQQMQLSFSHTLARVTRRPLPEPQSQTVSSIGVVEVLSALREVSRSGPELESVLRGMATERSMYRIGPVMEKILGDGVFDPARVRTADMTLRLATVSLESGELRYVTEAGAIVDIENRVVEAGPVDLTDAILASCALPAVFEPVTLGAETYVDGGVRETLPSRLALDRLGVTRCYAVVANPPGVPRENSFARADLLSVLIRTTAQIMTDEGLKDEVEQARRRGAIVIAPEIDVHDILTVEPGLTAISIDYGYLRAAEAVQDLGPELSGRIAEVISLRREIWQLERSLFVPRTDRVVSESESPALRLIRATQASAALPAPAEQVPDLTELGELKHRLRDLVADIPAAVLPPGADRWWQDFEPHNFEITATPSWR